MVWLSSRRRPASVGAFQGLWRHETLMPNKKTSTCDSYLLQLQFVVDQLVRHCAILQQTRTDVRGGNRADGIIGRGAEETIIRVDCEHGRSVGRSRASIEEEIGVGADGTSATEIIRTGNYHGTATAVAQQRDRRVATVYVNVYMYDMLCDLRRRHGRPDISPTRVRVPYY